MLHSTICWLALPWLIMGIKLHIANVNFLPIARQTDGQQNIEFHMPTLPSHLTLSLCLQSLFSSSFSSVRKQVSSTSGVQTPISKGQHLSLFQPSKIEKIIEEYRIRPEICIVPILLYPHFIVNTSFLLPGSTRLRIVFDSPPFS